MVKRQCESATVQDGGENVATELHNSDASMLFCGEGKDDLFNYCENDFGSR